jgi:hypothetical protein
VLFPALVVAGACLGPSTALASGVWSAPTHIGGDVALGPVSCSSPTFCLSGSSILTYNGTSWSAPTNISGDYTPVGEGSCPSATFCGAIGWNGNPSNYYALTYNGRSWSAPTSIYLGSAGELDSVSCSSATFCVAIGSSGNDRCCTTPVTLTYNDTSWSAPTNQGGGGYNLSCPSATFCTSVGNGESAWTYNGTSWSAPTIIGSGINPTVSCSSATFCAAVDQSGYAETYNGTSWSAPTKVDSRGVGGSGHLSYPGLFLSCPSATFCAAVDTAGNALTYNGTSWSAPTNIDPTKKGGGPSLASVSCPSTTFCLAVDANGNALTYTTPTAGEASASVKIEKFKVTTSSLVVTIKTSRAGTVTITGPGLKKTTRTVAAGTRVMTVALTKAGKAERAGRKKIKLSVSLKTSIKTVSRSVEIKL